jgi:hypothetical protein
MVCARLRAVTARPAAACVLAGLGVLAGHFRLKTQKSSAEAELFWSGGAGDGIRTRDFNLGKVALYH